MTVDRADIDRSAGAAAWAVNVHRWHGGHQGRADCRRPQRATALSERLVPPLDDASRHKSMDVLQAYVRDADMFRDHAGAGLL